MPDCEKCKQKFSNLFFNKLCVFCDIVYNLNKNHSYKYVICKSELEQDDVIRKTYEYFMKNDVIPVPDKIDSSAQIIMVSPYNFAKNITKKSYKIFFTNHIDRNNIKTKRLTDKYPIEKLNVAKYCDGIDLQKIDQKTYNEYINNVNI